MTDDPSRLADDLEAIAKDIPVLPRSFRSLRALLALLPNPIAAGTQPAMPAADMTQPDSAQSTLTGDMAGSGPGTTPGTQITPGTLPGAAIQPGSLPPAAIDHTPPTIPTGLTLTSDTVLDSNGATIVRLVATVDQSPYDVLDDYFGTYIEVTQDNDLGTPDWTQPMVMLLGKEMTKVAFEGVAGNVTYWARAIACDMAGNKSAYSDVVSTTTAKDGVAPEQPANLTGTAGFKGVAVKWLGGGEADLLFYQLRWGTNGTTWPYIAVTRNNVYWVPDLEPDTEYYFQVRAVDVSGNVCTTNDPNVISNYLEAPNAGYTASVTATPTAIGASDLAAHSITSELIDTAGLSADLIKGGKIVLRPTGTEALEIHDSSDNIIGYWDPTDGITLYASGTNHDDRANLDDAYLRFYKAGVKTAEMGPDGIWADSIKLGALPGGHNVIPNSSFEMSAFITGAAQATFTDATGTPGWKAAYRTTSPDNVTEGADLTPTTWTYA